jgi:hypothetical protein
VLSRFVDDDFGYLQWLRDRPGTFVLDTERRPSRSFVVVHRTTCSSISGQTTAGGWTTRQIKVCASTYEEIEDWTQYHVGVQPTRCHLCHPASTAATPARAAADPSLPSAPAGGSKRAGGATRSGAGDGTPSTPKRRSPARATAAAPKPAKASTPKPAAPAAKPATAVKAGKRTQPRV